MIPNISFVEWFIIGLLLTSFFYIVMFINLYMKYRIELKHSQNINSSYQENKYFGRRKSNRNDVSSQFDVFFI
jgi:hypothetical protein